jgi:hypothetical protein
VPGLFGRRIGRRRQRFRNLTGNHAFGYLAPGNGSARPTRKIEISMANRQQRRIVQTPTHVRQAELGPSVLALLLASTGLAVLILGVLWFVFFRS